MTWQTSYHPLLAIQHPSIRPCKEREKTHRTKPYLSLTSPPFLPSARRLPLSVPDPDRHRHPLILVPASPSSLSSRRRRRRPPSLALHPNLAPAPSSSSSSAAARVSSPRYPLPEARIQQQHQRWRPREILSKVKHVQAKPAGRPRGWLALRRRRRPRRPWRPRRPSRPTSATFVIRRSRLSNSSVLVALIQQDTVYHFGTCVRVS